MRASFAYSVDLFDPPTIVRMTEHFVALLRAALARPGEIDRRDRPRHERDGGDPTPRERSPQATLSP